VNNLTLIFHTVPSVGVGRPHVFTMFFSNVCELESTNTDHEKCIFHKLKCNKNDKIGHKEAF